MKTTFWVGLIFLVLILILEKETDWDLQFQNLFFDFNKKQWIIYPELHQSLSFFLYKGMKVLVIGTGLFSLIGYGFSFIYRSWTKYRQSFLMLLLSLTIVPLGISSLKQVTNVYCPVQLSQYDGSYPFTPILGSYPEDFNPPKRGKCFPAGHATTGFAFMALYFVFEQKKKKYIGLSIGIVLGITTGAYQMLRGQHFLSHTLFTAVLSWVILTLIYALLIRLKETKYGNIISPRSLS